MFDGNETHGSPSQSDNVNENAVKRYLNLAEEAVSQGDAVLGMHLYLAAFEQATKGSFEPDEAALEGLRRAWELACRTKERSLAEYIFERMEPYVDSQESMRCAEELQRLALDKLEEFGLSREDIEDMAEIDLRQLPGLELGVAASQAGERDGRLRAVASAPAQAQAEGGGGRRGRAVR